MAFKKYSYIGRGRVNLNGRFIGNVPELQIGAESESEDLADFTQGGGGLYDSVERPTSVTFSFNFNDYNPDNFAMALFGTTASVAAASVSDLSIAAPNPFAEPYFIPIEKLADLSQSYSLTSDPAGTTFTTGAYELSAGGIYLHPDQDASGNTISAGQALLLSYESLAHDLIQAFVSSGGEYELVFDGLNDARGNPVVVQIFKAKPGAAEGVPLISSAFAENTVNGSIVLDPSKTGAGLSKYFTVKVGLPA